MVPSAENLRAFSSFCLPTVFLCSGNSCAQVPDTVELREITLLLSVLVYTGVIVKKSWIYTRVQEPRMAQPENAESHTLSAWQKSQEKELLSKVFSTYFLKSVWDYAPSLPRKSLPLQSIIHVSKTAILFSSMVAFKENAAVMEYSVPCILSQGHLYFLCSGKSKGASFQITVHLHHKHLSLPDFSIYIPELIVASRNNTSFIPKSAFVVYSSVFCQSPFIVVYR